MPSKKKKYNARFPAGRIKKIMQTDEEVGKVAQAVPVIISRTLELFVKSLLTKSAQITQARNAKTLTPSHMKQCILSENRFDFLKDLVKNIPDAVTLEDPEVIPAEDFTSIPELQRSVQVTTPPIVSPSPCQKSDFAPNFYTEQGPSQPTQVIQFGSSIKANETPKLDFSIQSLVKKDEEEETPKIHIDLTNVIRQPCSTVTPLQPLARNSLYQATTDNLYIDEDYDN